MNPTPPDWPRISSSIFYREPVRAIDWLCAAFGFEIRLKVEDGGRLLHSELTYGGGLIMVGGEGGWTSLPERDFARSPSSLAGHNTQCLMVYVDDVRSHHDRAVQHGAIVFRPLTVSDYGPEHWADEGYGCEDLEGHTWYFAQRLRTGGVA